MTAKSHLVEVDHKAFNAALARLAQAKGGFLQGWTFFPTRHVSYINKQRTGKLWYAAPDKAGK